MKKLSIIVLLIALAACSNNNKTLIVASETASVKYQCPMKCQGDTAYTTAGTCPVCKMDLKKL